MYFDIRNCDRSKVVVPFDEPLYSHLGSLSNFTPDIHFNPLPDFGDLPTLLVKHCSLISLPSFLPGYKISSPIVCSTSSNSLFLKIYQFDYQIFL